MFIKGGSVSRISLITSFSLWNIFKKFFICTAPRPHCVEGRYIKASLLLLLLLLLLSFNNFRDSEKGLFCTHVCISLKLQVCTLGASGEMLSRKVDKFMCSLLHSRASSGLNSNKFRSFLRHQHLPFPTFTNIVTNLLKNYSSFKAACYSRNVPEILHVVAHDVNHDLCTSFAPISIAQHTRRAHRKSTVLIAWTGRE